MMEANLTTRQPHWLQLAWSVRDCLADVYGTSRAGLTPSARFWSLLGPRGKKGQRLDRLDSDEEVIVVERASRRPFIKV